MSRAQRIQDLIHVRDGQLAKSANAVQLLVGNSDPSTTRLVWDDHEGASMVKSSVGSDRQRGTD